jgi:GT2 family glycosyltransferase/SAM-dependent methyltransferase/glycosyltransferase involved in cell wall biosynthesis
MSIMGEFRFEDKLPSTGERCLPWTEDYRVIFEHYHRYYLASRISSERRVLDLACGEGYGADILSVNAKEVIGVDIDDEVISHAIKKYQKKNLRFECKDILDLSDFDDHSFDLITCFEALEHVEDHEKLLSEVKRLLKNDGIFMVSTPDKLHYRKGLDKNPFHVKELTFTQFRGLLKSNFQHVLLYRQGYLEGSAAMSTDSIGLLDRKSLTKSDGKWEIDKSDPTEYLIGVAANIDLPKIPSFSLLEDPKSLNLLAESELRDELEAQLANLVDELNSAKSQVFSLRRQFKELEELRLHEAEIYTKSFEYYQKRLSDLSEIDFSATKELAQLKDLISIYKSEIDNLRQSKIEIIDNFDHEKKQYESTITDLERRLNELLNSRSYKAIAEYRRLIEQIAPRGSTKRKLYSRFTNAASRLIKSRLPTLTAEDTVISGPIDLGLSKSAAPRVSIVIPVYNNCDLTLNCLRSIAANAREISYEVILVDDCSDKNTSETLSSIKNVNVIRHETNLGYVKAVNSAIDHINGKFVLLLNNDAELLPGTLSYLVDTMNGQLNAGVVGSKLIYPDGRLQEAGGIILSDGRASLVGRDHDTNYPAYNYLTEVDYCSGAALLVRTEIFKRLGGLDERYSPAYYDDVDLAFSVRSLGYKVYYQPNAVVLHHEGASHGTDIKKGVKKYQEINRKMFYNKWKSQLKYYPKELRGGVRDTNTVKPRIIMVDATLPRPDHDAGSYRCSQLIGLFLKFGYHITFIPDNREHAQPYLNNLQQLGVEVLYGHWPIVELIGEFSDQVKLLWISRRQVALNHSSLLYELSPGTPWIYDTVDLHFLRELREAEITDDSRQKIMAQMNKDVELNLIKHASATVVVSAEEKNLLESEVENAKIHVIGIAHEVKKKQLSFTQRSDILFVGSFLHPPNVDAMLWCCEEIWPIIKKELPEVKLIVAGANPPEELLNKHCADINVRGWVENLQELHDKCRVFFAPLRYGAGVKGKIGESLASGLPVVTTPIGVEGLGLTDGQDVLIGENAADLAKQVIELYTNESLWNRLSEEGQLKVHEGSGIRQMEHTLKSLLSDVGLI